MGPVAGAGRAAVLLAAWTALSVALALVAIAAALGPPTQDLAVLGMVLALAGALGVLATLFLARHAGRMSVAATIAAWVATVVAITVLNVVAASLLMFLSSHDLRLLLIVLACSSAVTAGPAVVLAGRMGQRAQGFERAAEKVGAGDLGARMAIDGRDEFARAGRAFNRMAERLEEVEGERAQLERARRDLFAAVSHDLRTPLMTMRAMVEALSDGVVSDRETMRRYLENIDAELHYLSQLIDDLFELARLDSGELRLHLADVRLDHLVEEAVDAFRPAASRAGVALRCEVGADTGTVRLDAPRVTRALYNLVQNAIRHTPPDGTVTVRLRRFADAVEVAVTDTGEGIAEGELTRVFERFYRGERSRSREQGGAGLGLAIVRSIVEAHGGSVSADSRPHEGSTFRLVLPAAQA